MSDELEQQAARLAKSIFDRLSEVLDEMASDTWGKIDPDKEPEKFETAKQLWGKGLMAALAQQLGVIEGALVMGDGHDLKTVMSVREMWIQAGHRIASEAIEQQRREEQEN